MEQNTNPATDTLTADYVALADGRYGKKCWKCMGAGFLPYHLNCHNGICYACNGAKYSRIAKDLAAATRYEAGLEKARVTRQAARVAKAEAEAAAHAAQADTRTAEYAAWVAQNTELAGWLDTVRAAGEESRWAWILDLAPSADGHPTPTVKQAAVLAKWHPIAVAEAAKVHVHLPNTIGEKVTVTGVITKAMTLEGNYGYATTYTRLVLMEVTTDTGVATVKMTTTAGWAWDVEKDSTVTVTGTVKDHGSYDGRPQTILTRPKLNA